MVLKPVRFALAAALVAVFLCPAHAESCIASVYSTKDRDQNGTRTASGIRLDDRKPTMAHRTLPLRSYVTVTHGRRSLTVQITDRGPNKHVRRRCVDLSVAAAKQLACDGLCRVTVTDWR